MKILVAGLSGLLFGLGLILAGMSNPGKVIGFLDPGGAWDPSLALVMLGAIAVSAIGLGLAGRRRVSWTGQPVHLPPRRPLQNRLWRGGMLFGAGWGLVGLCPGPDLVLIGTGHTGAMLFGLAMLAGFQLHDRPWRRPSRTTLHD